MRISREVVRRSIVIEIAKFASVSTLALLFLAGMIFAQTDPGVQTANRNTGQTIITSDPNGFLPFFQDGQIRFQAVESVSGSSAGNNGLGPRFNSNQCSSCHAQPAVGGTGLAVNPQFGFAGSSVAPKDATPYFITANGPTREARFPFFFNPNGSVNTSAPNGGVEDLFTVSGRSDAGSCSLSQPSFTAAGQANDIIFRIPTPTFGAGLIEAIPDAAILANMNANATQKGRTGVRGHANSTLGGSVNLSGNDGTITRFGWKAQNKSLLMFAGEAYNVEMGISNELFPQERDETPGCDGSYPTPNDTDNFPPTASAPRATSVLSDIEAFANFMRMLAPPTAAPATASTLRGAAQFAAVGCALCHTPSFTTGNAIATGASLSPSEALSGKPVNLYSDLLVHHMGQGLADGISQGAAGPDEFRTAPLWGLGQRVYFLHDGRTSNLLAAIQAHSSSGSEANVIVQQFDALSTGPQQDLLNFLRSL